MEKSITLFDDDTSEQTWVGITTKSAENDQMFEKFMETVGRLDSLATLGWVSENSLHCGRRVDDRVGTNKEKAKRIEEKIIFDALARTTCTY